MADKLDYHLHELSIARDPSNVQHAMPRIEPRHKMILDIGCGLGQTLIAAQLADDVTAYGVDVDAEAIAAGQLLVPGNVHLTVAPAEALPFADGIFDLVICRVALPYTRVERTLDEISRVLKPGGEVWLALHPLSMYVSRAKRDVKDGRWKDLLYCCGVMANGALFNLTGAQIALAGRTETFQSEAGIRRAMARRGMEWTRTGRGATFVMEGRKR